VARLTVEQKHKLIDIAIEKGIMFSDVYSPSTNWDEFFARLAHLCPEYDELYGWREFMAECDKNHSEGHCSCKYMPVIRCSFPYRNRIPRCWGSLKDVPCDEDGKPYPSYADWEYAQTLRHMTIFEEGYVKGYCKRTSPSTYCFFMDRAFNLPCNQNLCPLANNDCIPQCEGWKSPKVPKDFTVEGN